MRRFFVFALAAITIASLLGAIGLGVLLAKFDPNDYKGQFQAALEEATGWKITLHGDLSINFLPSITLGAGRMSVEIPGGGKGQAAQIGALTLSLSGEHLHQGFLDVQEVVIQEMTLNQDSIPASLLPDDGGNRTIDSALRTLAPRQEGKGGSSTPLTDAREAAPVADHARHSSGIRLQARFPGKKLTLVDSAITGKDGKGNDTWTLFLSRAEFSNLGLDSDVVLNANGEFSDPLNLKKTGFSVQGTARLSDDGLLRGRVDALSLRVEGLGDLPLAVEGRLALDYNRHTGAFSLKDMAGSLRLADGRGGAAADDPARRSHFGGSIAVIPPKEGLAGAISGSLQADRLDLDMLLHGLDPSVRFVESGMQSVKGAPNFTRPKVTRVLATTTGRQLPTTGKNEYPSYDQTGKKTDNAILPPGLSARYSLTLDLRADELITHGLQLERFSMQARSSGGRTSLPFSFAAYGGEISGAMAFNTAGRSAGFALNSQFKSVNLGKVSAIWGSNYYVGGVGSGFVNVAGQGNSSAAIINSLSGKAGFQVNHGEIKGFDLTPPDLPNFENLPEHFLFHTLSASLLVEGGKAASKDIMMDSDTLQATGSGVIHLSFGQMDLVVNFTQEGRPAAVPVFINGPYASLSSTVDTAKYSQNAAPYGMGQYYDGYQSPYRSGPYDGYGQGAYGQDPYRQSPYGQDPYRQYPHGQDPYRQPPHGQGAAANLPRQHDPYKIYLNKPPLSGVQWQTQGRQPAGPLPGGRRVPPPAPSQGGAQYAPAPGGTPHAPFQDGAPYAPSQGGAPYPPYQNSGAAPLQGGGRPDSSPPPVSGWPDSPYQGGRMAAPPQGGGQAPTPPQPYEPGSGKIAPLGNPADIIYGR